MKITIVSDSPMLPTGFGHQAQLLGDYFISKGHTVRFIAYSLGSFGRGKYDIDLVKSIRECDQVISVIRNNQPDAVIVLAPSPVTRELFGLREPQANCPVYYWWAFEGCMVPSYIKSSYSIMRPNALIHMNNFSKDVWSHVFTTNRVAYHAVRDDIKFTPYNQSDITDLRAKWSDRLKVDILPSDYVLVNVNENYWRKMWEYNLQAFAALLNGNKNLRYIGRCGNRVVKDAFDLENGSKLFNLGDRFNLITSALTREELIELYSLSDASLNLSAGEGFGVSFLEAAMIGLPQFVTKLGVFKEIHPNLEHSAEGVSLLYRDSTYFELPNLEKSIEKWAKYLEDLPRERVELPDSSRFSIDSVGATWLEYLQEDTGQEYWTNYRFGYLGAPEMLSRMQKLGEFLPRIGEPILNVFPTTDVTNQVMQQNGAKFKSLRGPNTIGELLKEISFADLENYAPGVILLEDCNLYPIQELTPVQLGAMTNYIQKANWIIRTKDTLVNWQNPKDPDIDVFLNMLRGYSRRQDLELELNNLVEIYSKESSQLKY